MNASRFAAIAALLVPLTTVRAEDLRVAAAASLTESITEISTLYQNARGTKVQPVFAGSNVLARQIESGAPVDVFLSADEKTMEGLVKGSHISKESVTPLLSNSLVVVAAADSTLSISSGKDLANLKRLSIADPAAVPAGVYAKTWLTGLGLWDSISPKCVGAENVRAALAAVEVGNADAAIVYKTDAAVSSKVKIVFAVPAGEAPVIVYPVALCGSSKQPEAAKQFIAFLRDKQAGEVFKKRGFELIAPEAK